ncbi:MAG: glycosyltransferase family 4 protein [Myxacorys chilensis ATA2-1-KO14]|jgi:glycosyltransferase involved in cell wall biosynthesis|nr:glycosyltransferase family 4 protein [Myxacorys chilensis ATA2-1-KO14]
MKIALVNQPICQVLPPGLSSVGACSYGLAASLAQHPENQVFIYARQQTVNRQLYPDVENNYVDRNIHFRFLPSPKSDQILSKAARGFYQYVPFAPIFNRGMKPAPSQANWRYPGYSRRVAQDIGQFDFDIIHIQHSSQFLPAVREFSPKAKIILQLHAALHPQSDTTMLANRLQYADQIVAVGNHVVDKVRQRFPQFVDRTATLYNGFDAKYFIQEKQYKSDPQSVKRVMFVGRVTPEKGVHCLVQAFNSVAERYPNVELLVYGGMGVGLLEESFPMNDQALLQSMRSWYKNYIQQLQDLLDPKIAPQVKFLGSVPYTELMQQYYAADVFVFPPIWEEPFGLPPIEAMAAGTPAVGTRLGGVMETIVHGETGLLVEPNNPAALADAIVQLLENDSLRESMGRAARRHVFHHFTWDRIADRAMSLYNGLLG